MDVENTRDTQETIAQFDAELYLRGLPRVNKAITTQNLELIGKGGNHLVFRDPNQTGAVLKVNHRVFARSLADTGGVLPDEARPIAEKYVQQENGKYDRLYRHFGLDHCLKQKLSIDRVVLTQTDEQKTADTVVGVQELSDQFHNPTKLDFSSPYAEASSEREKHPDDYQAMNRALLGEDPYHREVYLRFNKRAEPLFAKLETEPGLREAVLDFIERYKSYYQETGEIIDLAGEDNVIFYQEKEKWNYKVGSVIKNETKEGLAEALRALESDPNRLLQDKNLQRELINGLAFMRFLNAIGLELGIGKVFGVTLSQSQLENLQKAKLK